MIMNKDFGRVKACGDARRLVLVDKLWDSFRMRNAGRSTSSFPPSLQARPAFPRLECLLYRRASLSCYQRRPLLVFWLVQAPGISPLHSPMYAYLPYTGTGGGLSPGYFVSSGLVVSIVACKLSV